VGPPSGIKTGTKKRGAHLFTQHPVSTKKEKPIKKRDKKEA
jgi:hypothetical protein